MTNWKTFVCIAVFPTRVGVSDGTLAEGTPIYRLQDFLAIDRFTGGGLDAAKFDALVLWRPRFQVKLLLHNPQDWEVGWLMQTLADVQQRLTAFGFGAHKGFGTAEIAKIAANYGYTAEPRHSTLVSSDAGQHAEGVYTVVTASTTWEAGRAAFWPKFVEKAQGFRRCCERRKDVSIADGYLEGKSQGFALQELYALDAIAEYGGHRQ